MKYRLLQLIFIFCLATPLAYGQFDFTISTIAGDGRIGFKGDGGDPLEAEFTIPAGIAVDSFGNVYIADQCNHRIRWIDISEDTIGTLIGDGIGGHSGNPNPLMTSLLFPSDIFLAKNGDIYIVDSGNHLIKKLEKATNEISIVAGIGVAGYNGDGMPAVMGTLNFPRGIAGDTLGNIYIADYFNNRVRKISPAGIITTVAGTGDFGRDGDGGLAINAQLNGPRDVTVDYFGNLYISDSPNHQVRVVDAETGIISTFAGTGTLGFSGDGGAAANAQLGSLADIFMTPAGNLYIADLTNSRIRNVACDTSITTVAGNGVYDNRGDGGSSLNGQMRSPTGVTVDLAGNIYIVDQSSYVVRKLSPVSAVFCGASCTTPIIVNTQCTCENTANIKSGAQISLYADSIEMQGPSGIDWEIFSHTGIKDMNGDTMKIGVDSRPLFNEDNTMPGGGISTYTLVVYTKIDTGFTALLTDGVNMFPIQKDLCTDDCYEASIADPCNCLNPLNISDARQKITSFAEKITFTGFSGVALEIKTQTGMLDDMQSSLPIGVASQALIIEDNTMPGNGISTYTIDFFHKPDVGYSAVLTDGINDYPINNSCASGPCKFLVIPWTDHIGLISFGLLIMGMSVFFIQRIGI